MLLDKKLQEKPEEQVVLSAMKDLRLAGKSYQASAEYL